jgi:CRISPR-associated protein Cmx8
VTEPRKKPAKKRPTRSSEAAEVRAEPHVERWNLAELPSAQHKAGLAGLAICVQFLQRKPNRKGVCEIVALDPAGLALRVDREGMQELFDDIYDATLEEQERPAAFPNKPPKHTVERTIKDKKGGEKKKTFHVYDQVVPRGAVVDEWDAAPQGSDKLWLKLWRDLVWTTLRGVPATREPYELRAAKTPPQDGAEAWDSLATGPDESVPLPSTYFLGAQTKTAENVQFRDRARMQVLLHFWPFAVPIYVPSVVERDGSREFQGYAIVVPDIIDLDGFVTDWTKLARERGCEAAGYVPRDAVVDLPAEAGLDLGRRAMKIVAQREGASATKPWLTAADVFHVEKDGNNVRLRSFTRLHLERARVDAYARTKSAYWSPEFRRQRIQNILDGRPRWSDGYGRLCSTTPEELTVKDSKFRHDCRVAFTEVEMTQSDEETTLEHRVYRMIRSFVTQRLAVKHGKDWTWERVRGTNRESEYNDRKAKIARDAFLAVRSRTGSDFVSYFTSTICSVPQYLGEAGFIDVARALHDESQLEHVRALTLLALSANS